MSVRGSLRTMSIEDLLRWIERRNMIGHLSVERGSVARSFHFEKGEITSASSNIPGEHLGQLLMSRGLVNEQGLTSAFQVQADTGVLLGKVLLMVGDLAEDDLRDVLELKVREAVCDVLSWDAGTFLFEDGGKAVSEFEIRVPLQTTIDLGILQASRWRQIREVVASDEWRFWISDHFRIQDPSASKVVRQQVARLVECVERGLTVNQMVLEHHGRRFQVLTHLADLIERGAIKPERRTEARTGDEDTANNDIEAAARGRAAGGDRAGALAMTRSALEEEPESESLQALHRELERSLFASLSRELLGEFRVPRLLKSEDQLEGIELNDHERYLVSRIDGHWDLLSLMRIAPIRDVEALLTFKRLAERGIISL
jgi:hypothetical protein